MSSGREGSPKSVLVVMVLLVGVGVAGTVAEHAIDSMTSSKEPADPSRAHSKNAT